MPQGQSLQHISGPCIIHLAHSRVHALFDGARPLELMNIKTLGMNCDIGSTYLYNENKQNMNELLR